MLFKMSRLAFYCGAALVCLLNSNAFAGQTTRVSVSSQGKQGNPLYLDRIETPSISADARYVAFISDAPNLVPGDTNAVSDVFVHDRLTHKTERVSISSNGKQGNAASQNPPSISADGRYVGFESWASNLVTGDRNNRPDIFIHDRLTHKTKLVSIARQPEHGDSWRARSDTNIINISGDNRYIAFASGASSLVKGDNNIYAYDVFVHDRLTQQTERVSIDSNGNESEIIGGTPHISFSSDGRFVAFSSEAANLVSGDTNNERDIFIHDRLKHKTERISISTAGIQANSSSFDNSLSADGRYVAFSSFASNIVTGDTNKSRDIFVYDRLKHKTERVSITNNGKEGNSDSRGVSISADGRYVSFDSWASNLVAGDTNETSDIFIHDRLTHKTERVSFFSKGKIYGSYEPSISADGRHVAFVSDATDLINNDTNNTPDIFVHDRLLDTNHHANLTITPTTKPATLKPDTQGTYLYTITNNGKDVVPDVSLIHLVSGGSAVSFKPRQGKCSASAVETVCHLGKLAAGKKLTLRVTVKAQSKAFSQQVTVSGAPVDAVPGNNQVSVVTPVK